MKKREYIIYVDRDGNKITSTEYETRFLRFSYHTILGRFFLWFLNRRWVSKLVGSYMSSRLSKRHIKKFVKKNNIDLNLYTDIKYKCYNDVFTRTLKHIDVNMDKDVFISPCDSKLLVYNITDDLILDIKNSKYTIKELLKNDELANKYNNGLCLVFRLTVKDYHRYLYIDNGTKTDNTFIKGCLHTVQPIALKARKVFSENAREYTIMHTENFGDVCQMEVGALCVGKIANNHKEYNHKKGEEKGRFLFGGSTIILFVENGVIDVDQDIIDNSKLDLETIVTVGSKIGIKKDR